MYGWIGLDWTQWADEALEQHCHLQLPLRSRDYCSSRPVIASFIGAGCLPPGCLGVLILETGYYALATEPSDPSVSAVTPYHPPSLPCHGVTSPNNPENKHPTGTPRSPFSILGWHIPILVHWLTV